MTDTFFVKSADWKFPVRAHKFALREDVAVSVGGVVVVVSLVAVDDDDMSVGGDGLGNISAVANDRRRRDCASPTAMDGRASPRGVEVEVAAIVGGRAGEVLDDAAFAITFLKLKDVPSAVLLQNVVDAGSISDAITDAIHNQPATMTRRNTDGRVAVHRRIVDASESSPVIRLRRIVSDAMAQLADGTGEGALMQLQTKFAKR
jgi:hypothetical protein